MGVSHPLLPLQGVESVVESVWLIDALQLASASKRGLEVTRVGVSHPPLPDSQHCIGISACVVSSLPPILCISVLNRAAACTQHPSSPEMCLNDFNFAAALILMLGTCITLAPPPSCASYNTLGPVPLSLFISLNLEFKPCFDRIRVQFILILSMTYQGWVFVDVGSGEWHMHNQRQHVFSLICSFK